MGLALTVVTLTVPTTPAKVMRAAALATITMNKAIYPSNSSQIYTSECMPMSPCCHWLHRAPAGVGPFPEKFLSLLAGCCRYQDAVNGRISIYKKSRKLTSCESGLYVSIFLLTIFSLELGGSR